MKKRFLFLICVGLFAWYHTKACTNLIVGKGASADGSVIISYAADSYAMFGKLTHYPAATYPKGTMMDVYNWDSGKYQGRIEQATRTYNVIGNINEFQVSITETTFGGRQELSDPSGLLDYGSLIYIALQRSRTAKEAIKVMTSLTQEYGYCSSGESFTIADPNQVWVMEMCGKGPDARGTVWVAVRIPDDCICAHANKARITQFNMNDKENCLFSADVISFAREKGYFNGVKNTEFSFADAYDPYTYLSHRYSTPRVWVFFDRFSDYGDRFLPYVLGQSDEPMPLYVKANKKISVRDVQDMMRNHFEGTPFDMTVDYGSGPYKSPYRVTPLTYKVGDKEYFHERPISTQQTAFVLVSQLRDNLPDAVGGVLWFGMDDANTTVFTPVYCCATSAPLCYTAVDGADLLTFSWNSAFWVFNWVANMVYQRYNLMIDDIKAVQRTLEDDFALAQAAIERTAMELLEKDEQAAVDYLTRYTHSTATNAFETWKKLGTFLIVKYNDGVIKGEQNGVFLRDESGNPESIKRPGYPVGFLEELIDKTGDRYLVR